MMGMQVELNGGVTCKTWTTTFGITQQVLLVRAVGVVAGPALALGHRRMDVAF